MKKEMLPGDAVSSEAYVKDFFDMVAPSTIKFYPDHFVCGDSYRCVWALKEYPPSTTDQAILSRFGDKEAVTLHLYSRFVDGLEQRKILQNASRKNKMLASSNDLEDAVVGEGNLGDVVELMNDLRRNREPLLHCAVFLELSAGSLEKLKELQADVAMELTREKLSVDRLTLRQKEGFISCMPCGYNAFGTQFERVLPASAVANCYPFNYSGKTDPHGFYLGKDKYGTNIMPEEDSSKYFMVSLIIQQLYREILAVADENGGKLKNRVVFYCDEFGTLPKIESAEMMFSASRSRRVSIVPIIQSLAQLEKNYGKEGAEIIVDNTQLTVFGGFAPNSETAQVLSKSLGTKTVMSGSVSQSKNDPSRSLQMIERPLMTAEELKALPKGTFIVTKTGFNPIRVKLKLFFEWGIQFEKEPFVVPLRDNKDVCYADRDTLMRLVYEKYAFKQKKDEDEIPPSSISVEQVLSEQNQPPNGKPHDVPEGAKLHNAPRPEELP